MSTITAFAGIGIGTFTEIIAMAGYWGVFLLMLLESTAAPVPSELVMPFAGFLVSAGRMDLLTVILIASAGSIIGSLISYWIGRELGKPFIKKYGKYVLLNLHHLELTEKFFSRHGTKTIFFSRFIPVIRHLISIPAGAAKMNLLKFSFYTFLGALGWNSILVFAGIKLKENWVQLTKFTEAVDMIIIIIIIAAATAFFWSAKKHRQRKHK
ncbi:MAG: DedA family protein [Candidatus Diapherotrites archaeon]